MSISCRQEAWLETGNHQLTSAEAIAQCQSAMQVMQPPIYLELRTQTLPHGIWIFAGCSKWVFTSSKSIPWIDQVHSVSRSALDVQQLDQQSSKFTLSAVAAMHVHQGHIGPHKAEQRLRLRLQLSLRHYAGQHVSSPCCVHQNDT